MEDVNGPAFIEAKSDMAELAAELCVEIELLKERPLLKYDGLWVVSDMLNANSLKRESAVAVAKILSNILRLMLVKQPLQINSRDLIVAAYTLTSTLWLFGI